MTAPNSSQGPGMMPLTMTQSGLPTIAPQSGLPTIAPAPSQHPQPIQTSQIQQLHSGSQSAGPGSHQTLAGQPMTIQQGIGQPQFLIQPSAFPGGQQYTTFPQFAYTNQQGQIVLQPAPQFSIQGGTLGQQGQQVILTNLQQKSGQPQMIVSTPGATTKQTQPTYTMTSSGPIHMQSGAQPGSQHPTFMIPNQMTQNIPCPVSMSTSNGQSNMNALKVTDGKQINCSPSQINGPSNTPQFVIPAPGMAYIPTANGPHQIIQNGQQLIFQSPVPQEQQVMFSSSPQQHQQQMRPTSNIAQVPNNHMGSLHLQGPRSLSQGAAPSGKTSISRAIAPLPTTISQANNRVGLSTTPATGQGSPKMKQKMSPRGAGNNVGRSPLPKNVQRKFTHPTVQPSASLANSDSMNVQLNMNKILASTDTMSQSQLTGPPNLSPMMLSSASVPISNPQLTNSFKPLQEFSTSSIVNPICASAPVSTVSPITNVNASGQGLNPPTLTKEANMPSVSLPDNSQSASKPLFPKNMVQTESKESSSTTPKAVVKPQVVTHVIDGHIIKESCQPFPVNPVSGTVRRKSEKNEDNKQTNTGTKRGPGRPPGSTNKATANVKSFNEPVEKQIKSKEDAAQKIDLPVPSSTPKSSQMQTSTQQQPPSFDIPQEQLSQNSLHLPVQNISHPEVANKPQASNVSIIRGNPLKWSVTEVCEFVKSLPGCAEYVDDFAQQEIDGQALMLLKADHLMTAMSIKLGPALKISSHIDQLREELAKL